MQLRNAHIFTALLCFLLLFTKVEAQDLAHYSIDNEDGLPSNEVYQTLQDQHGFLWIGCDAGLYRYDGLKFKSYSASALNSRSISNLKIDRFGTIWCQNFTGQILRVRNNQLEVFYDGSKLSSQYPAFTLDQEGHVWIASDKALLVYDLSGKLIKKWYNANMPLHPLSWLSMQENNNRIVLVDVNSHFFSVDCKSFKISSFTPKTDIGSRHLFFQNDRQLTLFSEKNPKRHYYLSTIQGNTIATIEDFQPEMGGGTCYFYKTIQGVSFMGTAAGLFYRLPGEKSFKKCFAGKKVSDVHKDKEGTYWFSTLQDGILVVPNLSALSYQTTNSSLTDNHLSHLFSWKNQLFVGTYSGEVSTFQNHSFKRIQSNTDSRYRAVRKIITYKSQLISACGVLVAPAFPQLHEHPELNNIRDMAILEDRLYFTTPDRTGYVDLSSKNMRIVVLRKHGGKRIAIARNSKQIFLACTDGLFLFYEGKIREIKYQNSPIFVVDLAVTEQQLWLGTMNHGVVCALLSNLEKWETIDRIPGKHVRKLILLSSSAWFATEQGLIRWEFPSNTITNFNALDGIDFLEINDLVVHNQQLYVATIRGLLTFPVQMNGNNSVPPSLSFTQFKLGNRSLKIADKLELAYNDKDLTLYFQAASLRSRGSFNYWYRIKNFNNSWKKLSANAPFITITGLPSGAYTVEVKAQNEDGVPSREVLQLQLRVKQAWYTTWWFISLLVVSFLALSWYIFQLRFSFVERKAEARNELMHSQLTALKAQMNPHFMYNTLSSIQDFIWKNDIKNSNRYLSKFSLLMRKVLDASDQREISLEEEMAILQLYLELEQLRFGDDFQFTIGVNKNIDIHNTYLPAMLIQPFVENALKHGLLHQTGIKKVTIDFMREGNNLSCRIIDNGIGRAAAGIIKERQAKQHKSFATTATKKRIDLLSLYENAQFSCDIIDLYENEKACGTSVHLNLPVYDS